MKYIITSLLLTLSLLSGCDKPNEESLTSCEELTKIDRDMLDLIAQIEREYQDDQAFITAFKNAQVYWTQYRNHQVKAVFPLSHRKYNFDVGACKCVIMTELTAARVEELKKWTVGVATGECAGTYKTKRN